MDFELKCNKIIKNAINEYLSEKEAIGAFSPSTIKNRNWELKRFERFCSEHNIQFVNDINKNLIIAYLKQQMIGKSSKAGIMFILSGFMDYLVDEELVLDNCASNIEKPKTYLPRTDYLSFDEIERLFQYEAQHGHRKNIDRNLLLFSLLTDICLRVSEASYLRLEDVRLIEKEIWITRKRQKTENIPISDYIVHKFENWYFVRNGYKGHDLPWVFLSSHGKRLKPRQIHNIITKALSGAGILKRKHGPHLLRHSGASLKARSGENLIMIQHLLGHENLNTTRRYLHFNWDDLRQMVDRSHPFGK